MGSEERLSSREDHNTIPYILLLFFSLSPPRQGSFCGDSVLVIDVSFMSLPPLGSRGQQNTSSQYSRSQKLTSGGQWVKGGLVAGRWGLF